MLRDFLPVPLPTGERKAMAVEDSEAMRLGRAWHTLLEHGQRAPVDTIARAHALSQQQTALAIDAAARVRSNLPHLFTGKGEAEIELVTEDGELLRVDRVVENDGALWIIDFKWRVTGAERPLYEAQVRRYAQVLRGIRSRPVRIALVSADGALLEIPD
jgi:ATP-dependent exoDNAse (exonuclease V) beta subunit